MNLENVRSSFLIYCVDSDEPRKQMIVDELKDREFQVLGFSSTDSLLKDVKDKPPHIIFLDFLTFNLGKPSVIAELNNLSPETRIIILSSREKFSEAYAYFEVGIFDFIFSDFFSPGGLKIDQKITLSNVLKSADHAVEMDFYKFKNEQLEQEALRHDKAVGSSDFTLHNVWLQQLEKCTSFSASIDCFMKEMVRYLGVSVPVVYFKYIPAYRSLVSSRSLNYPNFKVGETLSLKSMMKEHRLDEQTVEKAHEFKDLVHEHFDWDKKAILPLRVNGDLKGMFVFQVESHKETDSFLLAGLNSLALKVSNIFLERKLHSVNTIDEGTGIYTRKYLFNRLKEEVSRSRRIHIPVSFVLISIDNFGPLIDGVSKFEVNKVLRMLASLVQKSSRMNDIVGRISSDEFGLILSHTPFEGALVKAERIRQLIESADFSQVSSDFRQITVSLGVSEYPSHCRDTDDMLEQADRAMIEVSDFGGNQVCLSSVGNDFNPDFKYSR